MRKLMLVPAEIDRWLQSSKVGDELVYARAAELPDAAKGPAWIAAREKEGLVKLSRRPAGEMTEYVAVRTGKPLAPEAGDAVAAGGEEGGAEA